MSRPTAAQYSAAVAEEKPKRRRSRSELRDLMLEGGKALLLNSKPTIGFEELTYARVFGHIKQTRGHTITRGSVHERIWNSQRDFQLDVVESIVSQTPHQIFEVVQSGAVEALASADLTTPAGRRYTAQNVVRLAQNHSWKLNDELTSAESVALAVRFRLAELDPDDPEALVVADHIFRQRQVSTNLYTELFLSLMDALGLRFKDGLGADPAALLAVLGNAITIALSSDPLPTAQDLRRLPTGPNQELEEWTSSALGVWFIVKSMLELDDDTIDESERLL